MSKPPEGVTAHEYGAPQKMKVILSLFGDSKVGKTHFAVRSSSPRYIAYLDPNATLDYHLDLAKAEGFDGPVHKLELAPRPYDVMTPSLARNYRTRVEEFAAWARAEAHAAVARGEDPGTFIIDGCTMLKGYYERDMLGESATLGWRAAKGQKDGPSTWDYAKTNRAMRAFVSEFRDAPLDVILIWEGRAEYDSEGDVIPGKFYSTMPKDVPFAITCHAEAYTEQVPVIDPKTQTRTGYQFVPKIRIGANSYDMNFQGRGITLKRGFESLKALLMSGLDEE